ncbi:YhgE/Pip domain-containing protein [Paenibacillus roseipurpureus]|uniref:YhgE/Pip domain-containing protein n=1 Tax=Paenibacillus roseopurpureus TaxID=2918901 RepID=A0AA96LNM1_9BACL|nr:YhgE/Pip domain-containing protein [Paenibacillus sp. MBLB1832]WNR44354.1 YhgE/Pip domain-containing protein [Paenibacillus sp. MBLB1832]
MKKNNLLHVFNGEFRRFIKSPMLVITFVAVALVPILYSGFLIKGTWDPYGQLEKLPIAVVNQDQGAEFQGETRNIGNDFIDELHKNQNFAWGFMSAEEAAQGMRNNRYYATITVPASFSADAASITSSSPKQAELIFESNSFYNFVAGQIGESATKELKNKLSKTLTEAYSTSILSEFETISNGLSEAGKGASDLNAGAQTLSDGIHKVKTNLVTLADGTKKLEDNAGLLQNGANQLSTGAQELSKGAASLSSGASQLQEAGAKLEQGAQQALAGTSSLAAGLQASQTGAEQLASGLASSSTGSKQLVDGLTSAVSASERLETGSAQVAAGLEALVKAQPDLASNATVKELLAASKEVAAGNKQLHAAQQQLLAGSQSLNAGTQKLVAGANGLRDGQQQLAAGAAQLLAGQGQVADGLHAVNAKLPQLTDGGNKLQSGAAQLGTGASDLANGLGQFSAGVSQATSGAAQLRDGAAALDDGAPKLVDGSAQLASKLNEAAKQTAAVKADEQTIRMLAEPVKITANDDRKVAIYANGIAPYFISMALFAGSLVFTTIYAARSTTVAGATGPRLLMSKLLTFGLMSTFQALIATTVLVYMLGLHVQSVPLFYLFTFVVGLTFMLIIQMFVTWLDQPGRFVVLLLMILQLASSAGTYPLELLPDWAQAIHPWLPMTYAIQGFRYVISSGQYPEMWHQVGYLSIYLVAALILIGVYFLTRKKTDHDDEVLMPVKV